MNVTTYDIGNVNLVVGGRVITGYADGSAITASKREENFSVHVGIKGDVAIAENSDETGEIKVILKNTSPSVSYLNSLAGKKGENAIVAAQVIDLNTNGVRAGGRQCRVMKKADAEWGKEETEREFTIFVADFDMK